MARRKATENIHVSISKTRSTAILQGIRIEVSPQSDVVVYTNNGVQTRPPAGKNEKGARISANLNSLMLNGATIERAGDGCLVISTRGSVIIKPARANDTGAEAG